MRSAPVASRLLVVASALGAASAQAQQASLTMNLTSANGGAGTLFSWSYVGVPTVEANARVGNSLSILGIAFNSGNSSNAWSATSGTVGTAFATAPAAITGLNTGLVLTNTTTAESRDISQISFGGTSFIALGWENSGSTPMPVPLGQVIQLSGPASGSYLSSIAFSTFNPGSWVFTQDVYKFNTYLNVGTPVPEPSTYGLILGGLALAGAAVRRRRR